MRLKIGIVSDSHDNLTAVDAAVEAFRAREAEVIIHAGDFVAPFAVKRFLALDVPLIAVFGNCDGEHKAIFDLLPDIVSGARRETVGGRSFIVVHALEWLSPAERGGADVIVCGHTHNAGISNDGPLVINPGECGGWVTGRRSAAMLDTDTMLAEIFDLDV
jgi:hypothetical protein